jgi:DNA-binding MarR family transcriptional regulator
MDTAARLSRLLGPLRRAILRGTRDRAALPDLSEAQIELLRVVADGPVPVREAAERLRVASSTVSNLVRSMTAGGLVERRASDTDLRSVELVASRHARQLLSRYDEVSQLTLNNAFARLDPVERAALDQALPVLERLLTHLDEQ